MTGKIDSSANIDATPILPTPALLPEDRSADYVLCSNLCRKRTAEEPEPEERKAKKQKSEREEIQLDESLQQEKKLMAEKLDAPKIKMVAVSSSEQDM